MKINYQYSSPSMCLKEGNETLLGLSPDLSRDEQVSFLGRLKHPLVFRDAMLMLREIVISDRSAKKKERVEFFQWLNDEIERRILEHEQYLPGIREELKGDMDELLSNIKDKETEIYKLLDIKNSLKKQIDSYDAWNDYYKIERGFWKFIKDRDYDLWFVLDPVITVHKDMVSFEAFSVDESTYGCLSIDMDEFEMLQEPKLGTTNIDFSAKLAKEIERFRTYSDVKLSVNPGGFTVESGVMPEHVEKKIDLPETWIKGFNQVSSAAALDGETDISLSPTDMYDICSFLRRNKAHKSPRHMTWVMEPGKNIRIIFAPFNKEIVLNAVYRGNRAREEKIYGRRRWLLLEKLIPLSESFNVKLMGFGMPQFITADMGSMKMTVGLTSWSSNDWVKGTEFNILAGFIGNGSYDKVYDLLKKERCLSIAEINRIIKDESKKINKAGIGMLLRRGEGYFDPINNKVRFRRLCNVPIPRKLYETTEMEREVQENMEYSLDSFTLNLNDDGEFVFRQDFNIPNPKYYNWKYRGTEDYNRRYDPSNTVITMDEDNQILDVKCSCREFNKGSRNMSQPCSHILSLYLTSEKFVRIKEFEKNKEYKIKDIMETLL